MARLEYVEVRPEHESVLREIFASARANEIAALPDELRDRLIDLQFTAQTSQYASAYPHASNRLLRADGELVGRLLVDDQPNSIRLIDIAILEPRRGNGIGTRVLQDLCAWADRRQVPIRLRALAHDMRLRQWYSGFSFDEVGSTGGHAEMARDPRRETGT